MFVFLMLMLIRCEFEYINNVIKFILIIVVFMMVIFEVVIFFLVVWFLDVIFFLVVVFFIRWSLSYINNDILRLLVKYI